MESEIWSVPESADDVSAKIAELGPPRAEFVVGTARFVRQIVGAVLLLPLGVALIALPIVAVVFQGGAHESFLFFKLAVLGFVFLSGSVFLAVRAYRNRGLRVLVYPEGLLRLHRDEAHALFWEEIETLWRRRPSGAWAKLSQGKLVFTLKRAGGEEMSFDDSLPELARLGSTIERETLRHLLPRIREAIDAGRPVSFGKLSATPRGLSNGRETVPWDEVKPPRIEADRYFIDRPGHWLPWHNGSVSDTPNFHVLHALIREQARAARESAT